MKNKTTAALLAFFLGGFGVHLFYLDKPGRGLIYIVLVLAALVLYPPASIVVGIIAFIDFIHILTMSTHQFNVEFNGGEGNASATNANISDEIKKMFDLKESGAITEAEYDAKKLQLLSLNNGEQKKTEEKEDGGIDWIYPVVFLGVIAAIFLVIYLVR